MTEPLSASIISSFPDVSWNIYAKRMLEGFAANWPAEVPLLVFLDTPNLIPDVEKLIRPQDAVALHNSAERTAFLERNKGRDDPADYRKQASRFCHKVFALKEAADYWKKNPTEKCRYLIWLDADVLVTRKVSVDELRLCLPKQGDAVSYLGRKDWPHSECGWLAFDLDNGGHDVIEAWVKEYTTDKVFTYEQWHDSWVFDEVTAHRCGSQRVSPGSSNCNAVIPHLTNLTFGRPGMEIWPQSPMAAWSRHYKGPIAKQELGGPAPKQPQQSMPLTNQPQRGGISIQTKNSRPNEEIQRNILENQAQIKNWIKRCKETDEEIVVVSAGPMLVAEDLLAEIAAGRKIVAVKHALKPLKEAGITPWACILLDPRDHVYDFVEDADKNILWFVASQVTPKAVAKLLEHGCNVWGYHASVGAGEDHLTSKQAHAVVHGGSATATRGMFMLEMLGFRKFRLHGYDLCLPDKPNMDEKDEFGQPKHFEVSIDTNLQHYKAKRAFWTKAELLAQYQEFQDIIQKQKWTIRAFGYGIIPFITEGQRISNLRDEAKRSKLGDKKITPYHELLGWPNKTPLWARLLNPLLRVLPKRTRASSF